ncbi:MAG: hypothetical protein HZA49_00760 [Planctomycetes bacterium]|nr:hypothetical protein [Planctomycetota bacterium]
MNSQRPRTAKNRAYMIVAALGLVAFIIAFNYIGCGGGGGGGNSGSSSGGVKITGVLDATTLVSLPPDENSILNRFCRIFSPQKAYAQSGSDVNRIIAISSRGNTYTITEGTLNVNSFSLSVAKDKPYLLVLLYDTSIIGVYKVDDATGLDSFPLNSASTNIDLGTVALSGTDVVTGTASQPVILDSLGITTALASAIGVMDDEMLRLAGSLDVDQNGLLDTLEGKWFPFIIDFEFDPGVFTDTVNAFSLKSPISYNGYSFGLHMRPYDATLDFTAGGTLTSPANINGGNDNPSGPAWITGDQASISFYSGGGMGTNPAAPPAGTYVVTIPISGTALTKTYTFNNVKSYGIDSNLYHILIPTVKLNIDGSDRITSIEIEWWKKMPGDIWVQPDAAELGMLLHDSTMEIAPVPPSAPTDPKISVTMTSFSNPMTVIPPAQGFASGYMRMIYTDKFGYVYAFSWNN